MNSSAIYKYVYSSDRIPSELKALFFRSLMFLRSFLIRGSEEKIGSMEILLDSIISDLVKPELSDIPELSIEDVANLCKLFRETGIHIITSTVKLIPNEDNTPENKD